MFNFFKNYFEVSHCEEGYTMPKSQGVFRVSKKERKIWLLFSYLVIFFSFFIFFSPLKVYENLFLWFGLNAFPISVIFEFDFRIFKIIRLYLYSKSKNINKRIIYEGYMIDNYLKLFYKVFNNYANKKVSVDNTSFRYRLNCCWKNMNLSIVVKPRIVIVKINNFREKIKNNKYDFENILKKVNEQISHYT